MNEGTKIDLSSSMGHRNKAFLGAKALRKMNTSLGLATVSNTSIFLPLPVLGQRTPEQLFPASYF
jgi:hypothetical protein